MPEENVLSKRETEILQLAATGLTNREIAQALTISPNTVKVHLSNIFEKTGVASRTEATLYGMEHGIVEVPGGEPGAGVEQPAWRVLVRKYLWVWIPAALLVGALLVILVRGVLFPPQTPEAAITGDAAQRWQQLAPMPEPRMGMAAAAYDGDIYAIAGEGPAGVSGAVFRYLPEEDVWDALSDKPTPVTDVHAARIGEKLYVPGGRLADGTSTAILEIYDPRTDTWAAGAPLPQPVSAYALADFEGQLYLFGGWDGQAALAAVYIYDPAADAWQEGTPMAVPRTQAGAVALADKIVVLGGTNAAGALRDVVGYFPARDANGETPWEAFAPLPAPRFGFGAASVSETIYVIGGVVEGNETGEMGVGWLLSQNNWVGLPTNQDYTNRQTQLVSFGQLLVVFDPLSPLEETRLWSYQAFYTIFIPLMP